MTSFVKQKIFSSSSVGDKLKQARQEQGYALEEVSKQLGISFRYLAALENNNFSDIPGQAYLKQFLKKYCDYLEINFNQLWEEVKKVDLGKRSNFNTVNRKHFFVWSKWLRKLVVIAIIIALLSFLGWKVQQIFSPPELEIVQPIDNSVVFSKQIKVIGRSEPEVEITINNRLIFVDDKGNFETIIDLQKGLNLIKIMASKRYSRVNQVDIRVLLTEKQESD